MTLPITLKAALRDNVTLVATLLLVAAPTASYAVWRFHEASFRDGFLGNLAATILRVVVGIPIALRLFRWQSTSQEAAHRAADLAHRQRVLVLLRKELSATAKDIRQRETAAEGKWSVNAPLIAGSLWQVFSDSGELRSIDRPELLETIAVAYRRVATLTLSFPKSFPPGLLKTIPPP